MLETIHHTEAAADLTGLMAQIDKDDKPITILRDGARPMMLMPAEDYEAEDKKDYDAMDATEWLMSNPKNLAAFEESLAQSERGEVITFTEEEWDAYTKKLGLDDD